ncbi:hypothetical protein [Desulfoscipio gibsoniae]|uniref:hypothetical protein n=1 Tax=Desulfoscipio gibsoniae TaxID=102134 RepID=UPI000311CF16|nr:hypothetical protein [Desulfoscipio gibsoniae]
MPTQLIYLIDDPAIRYLLLIGTYRDNEVTGTHPLPAILTELQKAEIPVRHISLTPLGPAQTGQFIARSLHCSTLETPLHYRQGCFFIKNLSQSPVRVMFF